MSDFDSLFVDGSEYELSGPTEEDVSYVFGGGHYTTKVNTIQYTPHGPKPAISDFVNTDKYFKLLDKINKSNVSDDDKMFLKLAAARHIIFDFGKIANYYAYADKELQQLMEDSALVIIDFNDAVRKGFIVLDKRLDDLINTNLELEKQANA